MVSRATKCPHCGAELKRRAIFCTHCGKRLRRPAHTPTSAPQTRRPKSRTFLILGALVLIALCLLFGTLATLGTPDEAQPTVAARMQPETGTPTTLHPTTSPSPALTPSPVPAIPAGTSVKTIAAGAVGSITAWLFSDQCQPGNPLGQLSPGADAQVLGPTCYHPEDQAVYYQVALADGTICWLREADLIPAAQYTPPATDTPIATPTPQPTPTAEFTPTPEPTSTPARTEATVTRIVDGDTIEVDIAGQLFTIRYIGIDTPELDNPSGPAASDANRQLVEGKTVYLVKDVSEADQYGRLLRYVYLVDGTFVNAELVRQGYAIAKAYPPDTRHHDQFVELQNDASAALRGLWAPTPTPVTRAQPQPTPTAPVVVATPVPAAKVVISYIFYDGVVRQVESDEYAEIKNQGAAAVNIGGWRLNAGDPGQDFFFPSFVLEPGQSCRVYTNQNHPESCGFSFASGRAIWNNKGDCGFLYDASGAMVSQRCY